MGASLGALFAAIANTDPWDHHGAWDGGGGWWFLGMLVMTAWVALVVFAVWAFARRGEPTAAGPAGQAREILAARYARGEISTEEYRERLDELGR